VAINPTPLQNSNSTNNYIIIPARLASTRLPRKLLLTDTGHPLIWHTIQRALESKLADNIIVATEDPEIYSAVESYSIPRVSAVMTPPCNNGTQRVSVVQERLPESRIIINLQGDEPELPGIYIDELIAVLDNSQSAIATIAAPATDDEVNSPSVVKVTVTQPPHRALYFSRSRIPYAGPVLKHFGLYAYTPIFFNAYRSEKFDTQYPSESLEQLSWLENRWTIDVLVKNRIDNVGIDTREEYDAFVQRWRVS